MHSNPLFQKIHTLDLKVLLLVQSWRRAFLNIPFKIITFSGTSIAWFSFAIVMNVLHYQHIQILPEQEKFLNAMVAPLIAWISCKFLKRLFARTRPSVEIAGYEKIISVPTCGSFPSGHTATAIALFVSLLLYQHPLTFFVGVWAILVSFSRMYLGVHFLSDVLGGVIVGGISSLIVKAAMP